METPVNVQVIPQQVLQDQQAVSLDQALNNVSGVISNSQGGDLEDVTIRGFDTGQTVFLDGFRIYDHYSNGLQDFTDVDRIEILKGPAAILYGESEPGGIVNIISKQPSSSFVASLDQTFGSWNQYVTRFDVSGAANREHSVLFRLDGAYASSHSWRDGIHSRTTFIAPTVQWNPDPNTQVSLKFTYNHNPMIPDNGQLVPLLADGQLVSIPRTVNLYDPLNTWQTNDLSRIFLTISHDFTRDWSVKLSAMDYAAKSAGVFVNGQGFIPPGTPGNVGNGWNFQLGYPEYDSGMGAYQASTEKTKAVRMDVVGHFSTLGIRHTALLGADYSVYDEPIFVEGAVPTDTPVIPVDVTRSEPVLLDPGNLYSANTFAYDAGAYLQDQAKLPLGIDLLAGLRYQHWSTHGWYQLYGATNDAAGYSGTTVTDPYQSSAVTPRVGVLWEARTWLSVYGLYSEGFFPNQGYDCIHQTLKATGADDKELGVKYQALNKKLQSTLTVFQLTKTNIPTTDLVHLDTATNQYDFKTALGAVRSQGIEWDLQGELRPHWNLIATYAYTDARVTADNNSLSADSIASTLGHRNANVPYNMGSLWTTYDFTWTRDDQWTLGTGMVGRESSLDLTNTIETPGYAIFNLMAKYSQHWAKTRLSLQLNVDNLFDRDYFVSGAYSYGAAGAVTMAGVTYGTPRAIVGTIKLEL